MMPRWILASAVLVLSASPGAVSGQAEAPALSFPVACEVGRSCELQHYIDRDPGPGARDYRCGPQTYQAHSGVDIRLLDMAAQRRGVAVLAAADGVVAGVRDEMEDISVKVRGLASVANKECGNGVVVNHGGGWQTQYCHMARGSIAVKVGDKVRTGAALGRVGLSGQTEYPHLHLTVRRGDVTIDPFAPDMSNPAACGPQRGLWTAAARAAMPYSAGAVLNVGFAGAVVSMEDIEAGGVAPPTISSPFLVVYGRGIALLAGDVLQLELRGPSGAVLAQNRIAPLPRWQAQYFIRTGAARPPAGWAAGIYRGDFQVIRGGKQVFQRRFEVNLKG